MLKKYSIPIVAVTGSAGKTTTKEFIAAILNQRWKIVKTLKNNNLPNSTLKNKKKITKSTGAAVLEYAMALPGDIINHCKILKPSISIITNIGSAHIGFSKSSVERLARNKSNIVLGMQSNGLLLTNADDANSKHLLISSHKGKTLTVGIDRQADYRATNIDIYEKGSKFDVNIKGSTHTFKLMVLGRHNIYNALFAIAVADYLGFSIQQMEKGLENAYNQHLRFSRRLSVYELKNGITLVDDTKNSNPHACQAAIDSIKQMKKETHVTVFGDMRHLGSYTVKGHYEVGKYAAEKNIDKLIAYGKYARYIAKGAIENGMSSTNVKTFSTRLKLHQYLANQIKANSVVLVKGSGAENMYMTSKYVITKYKKLAAISKK